MSRIPESPESKSRLHGASEDAKAHAARTRLQNAFDQADALEGIREVAANLIGCEEVAVFRIDRQPPKLWLYWSFGIEPAKYGVLDIEQGSPLEKVLRGKLVFRRPDCRLLPTDDPVSALIPIFSANDDVCAVLVLFRLFAHKPEIEVADAAIYEVLSKFGGRAVEPN